ncbi:unnamed protein product [Coregonus sp. 'balchen']|nr:unnamed protein product [Coregonus sp. 'balchen']
MFQDVEEKGLTNRSEELKNSARSLLTEAMNAEKDLKDAEVSLTHSFTSQPVKMSKESYRLNTAVNLLNLDTNSVVFYVGGYPDDFTDSYTCVIVERGYLVLQRRQDNQVLKAKSTGKVSLNNLLFTIVMDTQFEVHVVHGEETEIVKMDYKKERFRTFYIGGLPASLRERDNRHGFLLSLVDGYVVFNFDDNALMEDGTT